MNSTPAAGFDFDYIVIGSGFGGSVSAMRLAEKGYAVAVLERGKRFRPKDFPRTNWDIFRYLWMPALRCFGIQNISLFRNVLIMSGTGVGGGSLVYANTMLEPGDGFFQSPSWAHLADWKKELAPYYALAKKMLGVVPNPKLTKVDALIKNCAEHLGKEKTFSPVNVAVYFGEPGREGQSVPDPYFQGQGPHRAGCNFCGGCMIGCRFNAKNTLDKNYLYFAEKFGARVFPESDVVDVRPLPGGGYEVEYVRSTAWGPWRQKQRLRAKNVVFSAGVLGTVNLLLRCRDVTGSLPRLSPALGTQVRTNSEAIIGITLRQKDPEMDCSEGIAISSGFHADEHTFIEPVRYPKGSSFMRLLAIPMVDGREGGHQPSVVRWAKLLWTILSKPLDVFRLIFNFDWAPRTMILLVMQSLDNRMNLTLGRNALTLFRKRLTTHQDPAARVPSYIPVGHRVARYLGQKTNAIPQSAINEVGFEIPTTAHILGGCGIGENAQNGVIDPRHRVFGYEGLYVCDGSVIPANLGVNPSLTITAMTERCMALIPKKADGP